MRDEPPAELVDLLARLHLATAEEVRSVAGRARRLAGDLSMFQSVWIDALVQQKLLTPYQGSEINASRVERLLVGPFVVQRLIQRIGGADCFVAREAKTGETVHLVVASTAGRASSGTRVQDDVARFSAVTSSAIARLENAGSDGDILWAAYSPAAGSPAIDWLSCHGRLPPAVALEIARQTAAALTELEAAGIRHDNLSAATLWLSESGTVQIACTGFPSALFKIASADDLFAFGSLCWHTLAGRPTLSKIAPVRFIAPDASRALADTVDRCLHTDQEQRPKSFAEIAAALGPPTAAGKRRLAAVILKSGRSTLQTSWRWEVEKAMSQIGKPALATAVALLLLAASTYPLWKHRTMPCEKTVAVATSESHPVPQLKDQTKQPVRLANYQTVADGETNSDRLAPVIELSGQSETYGAKLRLQTGATVRGKDGQRVRVIVPANGLIVAADKVRFENIDFIWRAQPEEIVSPERLALVDLRAAHVQFIGCTFQAVSAGSFELPAAIRVAGSQRATTLAPASHVEFERCTLQNIACAIDCLSRGPIAISMHNTLCLGHGPVVRFPQSRPIDAPAAINLENDTVRGAAAVVELHGDDTAETPAPLNITASGCVFVPDENGALIAIVGRRTPAGENVLKSIEWSGQGSLIPPGTHVAIWQHATKEGDSAEVAAEDEISVDGLVTSSIEFEGLATCDPATSKIRRWLGPVISDEPPGIGNDLPQLPEIDRREER